MGRRSPESKKRLRKRQKKKRLYNRQQQSHCGDASSDTIASESSDSHNNDVQTYDSRFLLPSDLIEQQHAQFFYPSSDEETFGLDLDALEMTMPPMENDPDSLRYLLQCRQRLLSKVKKYKQNYEELKTENIKLKAKHREEIESIRSFYQNISFGLTRSGKIVRAALSQRK